MREISLDAWNTSIRHLPGVHLLQSSQWASFKAGYGWEYHPLVWENEDGEINAAAMVLRRGLRLGIHMMYIPRGPLLDWRDAPLRERVLADLQQFTLLQKSIFVKMDPEIIIGTGIPSPEQPAQDPGLPLEQALRDRGWRFSAEQIQFRNTVWLHLDGDEATWLERMKPKTRYNLRLAQRKGVNVRVGTPDDFHHLYEMYAETSARDGFVIRSEAYYNRVWGDFMQAGMAAPLIAEVDGQAVAGLFLFWFEKRAWYLYGMSTQAQREKMPNYMLQWEAMRLAKQQGCLIYDLWGAPDVFNETDSMWGVFRFKEGLGGEVIRTTGAWDYVARPALYQLYTRVLPRLLDVMRRRGKAKTLREVSA